MSQIKKIFLINRFFGVVKYLRLIEQNLGVLMFLGCEIKQTVFLLGESYMIRFLITLLELFEAI